MWRSLWFTTCAELVILVTGFIMVRIVSRNEDLVIDGTSPAVLPFESLVRGRSYACRPPRS